MLKTVLIQTYILSVLKGQRFKNDFIFKNKSIFTFNDTGLDTQRFDKKKILIK